MSAPNFQAFLEKNDLWLFGYCLPTKTWVYPNHIPIISLLYPYYIPIISQLYPSCIPITVYPYYIPIYSCLVVQPFSTTVQKKGPTGLPRLGRCEAGRADAQLLVPAEAPRHFAHRKAGPAVQRL